MAAKKSVGRKAKQKSEKLSGGPIPLTMKEHDAARYRRIVETEGGKITELTRKIVLSWSAWYEQDRNSAMTFTVNPVLVVKQLSPSANNKTS